MSNRFPLAPRDIDDSLLRRPRSASLRGGLTPVRRWMEQHGAAYAGQWVALRDGVLLGAHQSRKELKAELLRRDLLTDTLVFLIPAQVE